MAQTLARKLKIKPGNKVLIINQPQNLKDLLEGDGVTLTDKAEPDMDVVLAFFTTKAEVDRKIDPMIHAIGEKGILWVAYPKGTAKKETDLNRDILYAHLAKKSLQGVAMVAVDDTWSAMRFKKQSS